MTGRVEIRAEPPFEDMLHIAQNLRARDRDELFATQYKDDPAVLARGAVASGAFRWAAYLDGEPVAAFGVFPRWPGVWTCWAYGTDKWPRTVKQVTRHARRFAIPALYNSGAHRIDCYALEAHEDGRKWIEALGGRAKNKLAGWGKNGETFLIYVWTRKDLERVMRTGTGSRRSRR